MKFNSFLNENDNPALLNKSAFAKYIKLLDGKHPLERSSDTKPDKKFIYNSHSIKYRVVQLRPDRQPLGYFKSPLYHNAWKLLNKILQDNGHVRRDECTMASSDVKDIAFMMSSSAYYLVPIGDFNYSWVNSKDFNYDDKKWLPMDLIEMLRENNIKDATEMINANIFTNKGFGSALVTKREIWMNPKSYYLFEHTREFLEWWNDISK